MSVVSTLKSTVAFLSKHPSVRVLRCTIGRKPPAPLLERAHADAYTPSSLIELCSEMNGLAFEWGLKPSGRSRSVRRIGCIRIPTLARNLKGWGLEDGYGAEFPEIASSMRVLDEGPSSSGRLLSPCFGEGVFGVWDHYNDIFAADAPLDEFRYLAAAADHLFMTEWFSAACDGEERPESVIRVREYLGLPPLA